MNLAPIVLFVYNRPWHTQQTLEALAMNEESKDSILFIYADGPKESANEEDLQNIDKTRDIIRQKQWCKEVHFIESDTNKGLASSVIIGTTEIVNRYGSVITLEDDVVVSVYFLSYMNKSLKLYRDKEKVWMVSGYYWPVGAVNLKNKSFFLPVSTTQAWGTWDRAWNQFDIKASGYGKLKTSKNLRKKFNLGNSYDFTAMLFQQMESGKIDSWAIRFWWSMLLNKGVILFPEQSLIKNIGWDGSGVHCGANTHYEDTFWNEKTYISKFPTKVKVNKEAFESVKKFHLQISNIPQLGFPNRLRNKISRVKNAIKNKINQVNEF